VNSAHEPYGMSILKDVMVPMRDGTRLATDVYTPAEQAGAVGGRWPTLLGRTSYDKEADWLWIKPVVKYFVPRGYVVVLQDIRGRGISEGSVYAHVVNPHEGPDGYDTIEWIARQPWSNGRVGTVGVSHGAVVQGALAVHRPPHLAAMWLDDGFFNWFTNGARRGGALELDTLGMMFLHAHDSREAQQDPAVARAIGDAAGHLRDWVMRMPLKPGCSPLALTPMFEDVFFNYYRRGEYDEFWKQDCINFEAHIDDFADVPTVLRCGWYDVFSWANTQFFARLSAMRTGPVRLIMGPWTHNACDRTYAGDVDFGPAAALDGATGPSFNDLRLRWFERWLRDAPKGAAEDPAVEIFVMGGGDGRRNHEGRLNHGGAWRAERGWPLPGTRFTRFYLHAPGRLSPDAPAAAAEPATFVSDPAHPVPTVSGNVASFYEHLPVPDGVHPSMSTPRARMRSIVLPGPSHQKEAPGIVGCRAPYPPLAARADVLVFQTPPLAQDTEVTGPIVATLWISSTARDTDFTAKLLDVYPPSADYVQGYDMNLADGIARTRYRNGYERPEFMTPGDVYELRIELGPTSNLFKAGHRIRVDLSGSNFPRFDVNPNTGEPLGLHTHTVVAKNTVYADARRPSHVLLPLIPHARRE
jgi:putative CocE/NonD family hydrolase